MNKLKNLVLYVFIFVFVLAGMSVPVSAENTQKTGSITLKYDGISGAPYKIYKVAQQDGNDGYTAVDKFKEYEKGLDFFSKEVAETLKVYVLRDGIEEDGRDVTDENGKILFDDLTEGAYLILGEDFEKDGSIYTAKPIFLSVPSTDEKTKQLIWDVEVDAKPGEKTPVNELKDITIQKIWKDNNNEAKKRPVSIVAQLLDGNGKVYDEVTLSADNGWRYTWKDLDANVNWKASEKKVPESYKASYPSNVSPDTLVIENTIIEKEKKPVKKGSGGGSGSGSHSGGGSGSAKKSSSLPQTGQLWWPIGILLCAGMLCIIIGKKMKKDNA